MLTLGVTLARRARAPAAVVAGLIRGPLTFARASGATAWPPPAQSALLDGTAAAVAAPLVFARDSVALREIQA